MRTKNTTETHTSYHHGNVRDACIGQALKILEREGLHQLSLRKIAKGIGVSHNAPYRWFKTREALLAAVTIRIFDEMQILLRSILEHPSGNPAADLLQMTRVYFEYARQHPHKYRLVAGSNIDNSHDYPDLLHKVNETLQLIHGFLQEHEESGFFIIDDCMRMSIYIVSAVHGYCSLVIENRFELLGTTMLDLEEQFEYTIYQLINGIT